MIIGLDFKPEDFKPSEDGILSGIKNSIVWAGRAVYDWTADCALSMVEGMARALSSGVASGVSEDLIKNVGDTFSETVSKVAEDVTRDLGVQAKAALGEFNQAEVGKKVGEFVKTEGGKFLKSVNFDPNNAAEESARVATDVLQGFMEKLDTEAISGTFAEKLNKGATGFTDHIHLDQISGKFAEQLKNGANGFTKNLGLDEITGNVGSEFARASDSFLDNLDIGARAETVGDELNIALNQFSMRFGDGLADAASNLFGKLRNEFIYRQLPYMLAASAATVATPLFVYYLYHKAKHNIGRPKLATKIVQQNIASPLTNLVSKVGSLFTSSVSVKPSYDPKLERQITEISTAVKNIYKNGGFFQNVIFYGPGGTGKTMISEKIAQESGLSYVKMSGGDLAQYIKRGEHVTELNKLLDKMETSWRPWSNRPWILFIDEAESLCRDRSVIPTAELLELQNALLNRTGTQSKKFMLILATNRLEDIDGAILDRMDHKLFVGPPSEEVRGRMIQSYLPQFFSKKEIEQFFSDTQVAVIASKTGGLTGRAIFKMLNALSTKRAATATNELTQEMVDVTINDTIYQEEEVSKRREASKLLKQ